VAGRGAVSAAYPDVGGAIAASSAVTATIGMT
jgi:hypothetical protein